jgi:endonuclease/exonuclease/phosphatase family metal-dependent hydrolase
MALRASTLANWRALDERLGADCVRLASYNLHGCVGTDGREDAERIARVILELGCDTVGLQEVNTREPCEEDGSCEPGRVHHSQQLDYLAERCGMQAVPGLTILRHDGHYGNALLTRRPIRAVRRHAFGSHRWLEPRNALDVELDVAGAPLRIIVTHLGLLPVERRAQVRQLAQLINESPFEERVIVLGDINEWLPMSRPLRWLHALLGHSPAERSFPSRWPLLALDRVWVRPRNALLALGAHRSPLAAAASDHLPVKAIIAATDAVEMERPLQRPESRVALRFRRRKTYSTM